MVAMNKEYKLRIDRVLQYIDANLSNKISLQQVAEISHFSAFHFHRIFSAIIGETVNEYIARRRLECAVNLLIFKPEFSITQVALESGFSSSANFAKAVKLHFGFSPSEIRNPDKIKDSKIGKISSKYGKEFHPSDLYPNRITTDVINDIKLESNDMKIEVRKMSRQRVCTFASQGGYAPEAIYGAWDKLIDWAINHGINPEQQTRFAFAFDNPAVTPIDKCRYDASIVISDDMPINLPFKESEIPAGQYAVLYYKGSPDETLQAQMSIYSDWLPNSGFEPDEFPLLENYLNDVRADGFLEMEIYVKLKSL